MRINNSYHALRGSKKRVRIAKQSGEQFELKGTANGESNKESLVIGCSLGVKEGSKALCLLGPMHISSELNSQKNHRKRIKRVSFLSE